MRWLLLLIFISSTAFAQFPEKPITLVVKPKNGAEWKSTLVHTFNSGKSIA